MRVAFAAARIPGVRQVHGIADRSVPRDTGGGAMRIHALGCFSLAFCIGGLLSALVPSGAAAATADSLRGRIRAVPNPWCANRNASRHLPGGTPPYTNTLDIVNSGYSRIAFYYLAPDSSVRNVPGTGSIKIFTVDGDLVRTIPHDRVLKWGWDLLTDSGQWAVSGIYIFTYESEAGGDVGKIIVIR
jgi:hypothetical protein